MVDRETEIVFFDAGETIVHPLPSFPELFYSVCAAFQFQVDLSNLFKITRNLMSEVEEKQRQGYTFTNDATASRCFWVNFYSALIREMGYDRVDGELPNALYSVFSKLSNYGAYDDVADTLQQLRASGLRLGLISNFEAWLEDLLHYLGLAKFFDVMIISGQEEFEKPHPKIFEIALDRSGIAPSRSLHVGDSPVSDFIAAREAGMQAVLLDRWGRFPDFEGKRVEDLRELLALLG